MSCPDGLRTAALAVVLALLTAGCDRLLPARPQVALPPPESAAAAASAPAPKPRRARPAADTAVPGGEEGAFNLVRRGLRRLVAAQQGFYAENGTYTEDFDRLGFRPDGATQFKFLWVTRDGWAASGTHPAIPGRDCVIFVGRVNAAPTTLRYVRSGREGVAACDTPPPPPRRADAPAPPPSRASDTASALDAVNPSVQMRVDLRNLVRAQEAYHATQGVYSRRIEPLQIQYLWQRGVTLAILSAGADFWSARASHAAQPGKSCVIWFGRVVSRPVTEAEQRASERPGVPVCDGEGGTR